MPTAKPRIQVTLSEDVYVALREYSLVSGQSMSSFMAKVLTEAAPNIRLLTKIIEQAKGIQQEALSSFVSPLKEGEDILKASLLDAEKKLASVSSLSTAAGGGDVGNGPLLLTRGSGLTKLGKKSKKAAKGIWLAASKESDDE
jgi:uncharacterized protein (DUF1778 family)